jgi:hypothetical protein
MKCVLCRAHSCSVWLRAMWSSCACISELAVSSWPGCAAESQLSACVFVMCKNQFNVVLKCGVFNGKRVLVCSATKLCVPCQRELSWRSC